MFSLGKSLLSKPLPHCLNVHRSKLRHLLTAAKPQVAQARVTRYAAVGDVAGRGGAIFAGSALIGNVIDIEG